MQLLILAHALDGGANAVAKALAPGLGSRVTLLRPERLAQGQWSQRVDAGGYCRTTLCWSGGEILRSEEIGTVWNRIMSLPQANFRHSSAADRDYAGAELHALACSWLAELGARVEPPMRRHATLSPSMHHLHWTAVASRCGLPLATTASGPETATVLRTPDELCGHAASSLALHVAKACHAMAEELGFGLLELGFSGTPSAPALCRVNARPALEQPEHAEAVARWLLRHDASMNENPRHAVVIQ